MTGSDAILSPDTLEGDKQLITVLLAQFNACRAEILARSTTQATIINLNVTATGLIAGYYFGYHANPLVLLVIPILSPMLGIIWADHAINIGNIGRFIQNGLMPKLGAALKQRIPDYEISIRAFERRIGWRLLLLLAPMVLLFAILPAAALVLALDAYSRPRLAVLFAGGRRCGPGRHLWRVLGFNSNGMDLERYGCSCRRKYQMTGKDNSFRCTGILQIHWCFPPTTGGVESHVASSRDGDGGKGPSGRRVDGRKQPGGKRLVPGRDDRPAEIWKIIEADDCKSRASPAVSQACWRG